MFRHVIFFLSILLFHGQKTNKHIDWKEDSDGLKSKFIVLGFACGIVSEHVNSCGERRLTSPNLNPNRAPRGL